MTAEVAVMNRSAVALAADSAATNPHKIYNSVNKLFQLSDHHPVGIMIFGNADIMNVPWETVIKIYRAHLSCEAKDTLEEYGTDFISWLSGNESLFPAHQHEIYVMEESSSFLWNIYNHCAKFPFPKDKDLDGLVRREAQHKFLEQAIKHYPELPALPLTLRSELLSAFGTKIEDLAKEIFEEANLTSSTLIVLRDYCIECLCRQGFESYSGVVIAGFGDKDIFPSLVEYHIEGMASKGFLKFRQARTQKITYTMDASITPFAQAEMVSSFMQGLHPFVKSTLDEYLTQGLNEYEEAIVKNVRGKARKALFRDQLKIASSNFINGWNKHLSSHQQQMHIQPVIAAVGSLPKDDLASMAESLVNLTALKRKMSTDRETVGGPIDVAVISKGDGFIWIKRKHYFSKEQNLRYMKRSPL